MTRIAVAAALLGAVAVARADLPDDGFSFEPFVAYPAGDNCTGVVAADVDGDGDLDLATANRNTDTVSVLLNDGTGVFGPLTSYAVGVEPRYVVAFDLDGDGAPDLASVDWIGQTISLLLNDGAGAFTAGPVIEQYRPSWADAGDVDGDGDDDLVVTILDERAQPPGGSPALISILRNDGGTLVQGGTWSIGVWPRGGALGDLDDDGNLDVITANQFSNSVTLRFGAGDGTFDAVTTIPVGSGPRYVAIGDLDGDGDADFGVVHKNADDLWAYENVGGGAFSRLYTQPVHDTPHGVAAGDFDGDGRDELVAGHVADQWVDVVAMDDDGAPVMSSFTSTGGPAHVIAADLDGDGHPEIVTANTAGDSASVHVNRTPRGGAATVFHVDDDAPPKGDGASWVTAFNSLDEALDPVRIASAEAPVAIWIAGGRYVPANAPRGDPRAASFVVPGGVRVLGHFDGESSMHARDLDDGAHETVLSGDRLGDDGPGFAGRADNVRHVVRIDALGAGTTQLDALVIEGGQADGGADADGAGVLAALAADHELLVRGAVLRDAHANGNGGGLAVSGAGRLAIVDTAIEGNRAWGAGGGLYATGVTIDVQKSAFDANIASVRGGAIALDAATLEARDAILRGGDAPDGGAIAVAGGALAIIGGVVEMNEGSRGGGVFADAASTVTLSHVVLRGNTAAHGGAVHVAGAAADLVNCLLFENDATTAGGAVHVEDAMPAIVQCTFADNTAGLGADVHSTASVGGGAIVENSILASPGAIVDAGASASSVARSVIAGGWSGAGEGNLDGDPGFIDPAADDYRITLDSIAAHHGEDARLPADVFDLDGDGDLDESIPVDLTWTNRSSGASVDAGAYETDGCPADFDDSGVVNFADLIVVLSQWGACGAGSCEGDLDGDGLVGFLDLLLVLTAWGAC